MVTYNGSIYLYCATIGQTLASIRLDITLDGIPDTAEANLAGLTNVESPGVFHDPTMGRTSGCNREYRQPVIATDAESIH